MCVTRLITAFETPTGLPHAMVAISHLGAATPEKLNDVRPTGFTVHAQHHSSFGLVTLFPCWFRPVTRFEQKSYLADVGTVQLEFRYLSCHTGDQKFAEKVR